MPKGRRFCLYRYPRTIRRSMMVLSTLLAVSSSVSPSPICGSDATHVELGLVRPGDLISHEFSLTNRGNQTLTLQQRTKSCSCLCAVAPQTILPDETRKIKISAKATDKGRDYLMVSYVTNDPCVPILILSIAYQGTGSIMPTPRDLDFGSVELGAHIEKEIELWAGANEREFRIESARTTSPRVRVVTAHELLSSPNRKHSLKVVIEADKVGVWREFIKITTNNPRQPIVEVPIQGIVAGPFIVTPDVLNFGATKPGQITSKKCQIRSKSGEEFFVKSSNTSQLLVETAAIDMDSKDGIYGASQFWQATVTISRARKPGVWQELIPFSAIDREGRSCTVYVTARGTVLADD